MTALLEVQIYHHKSKKWTEYLQEYSTLRAMETAGILKITTMSLPAANGNASFARLPEALRRLLFFGKPDIVVCLDDGAKPIRPIFALDVTEHVSAADHWMQRFPNLVGCAQEGVPGAFVTPGDMPDRANFTSARQPNFYYLFDRVIEIHQTPLYIAEWPSSDGRGLDGDSKYHDLPPHDSPGMAGTFRFFDLVLDGALKGREQSALMRERLIVDLRTELRTRGYSKVPKISDFKRLTANMPSGDFLDQRELESWLATKSLSLPPEVPERILKRNRYLIFSPRVETETPAQRRAAMLKRIEEKAGDPYGPQPLVFDYMFCRLGPTPLERDGNVVIDMSFLAFSDFSTWITKTWGESPLSESKFNKVRPKMATYSLHLSGPIIQVMKNYVRWQIFAADLMVFSDGVLAL